MDPIIDATMAITMLEKMIERTMPIAMKINVAQAKCFFVVLVLESTLQIISITLLTIGKYSSCSVSFQSPRVIGTSVFSEAA